MVLIDLSHVAPVAAHMATQAELTAVIQAAEALCAQYTEAELDQLLDQWETTLMWAGLGAEPHTAAWCQRALLLTCLRGIRGEIAPQWWWLGPDD